MPISQALIKDAKVKLGDRARDIIKDNLEQYNPHTEKSLCPFHSEKTPSFSWDSNKYNFKCFGCNETMDIYRYLEDYEGLTFIESVQSVFKRTGIEFDFNISEEDMEKQKIVIHERKVKTGKLTNDFDLYKGNLRNNMEIYDYIVDDWGFTNKTIEDYKLGYSDTSYYKDRIVIPYLNRLDQVIYATGRDTTGVNNPKYKKESNKTIVDGKEITLYPQTPLYNGQALINYKDDVLVVESEKDCITLLQEGFQAVAFSGSNYRPLQELERYENIKNIYIIPDNETTGVGDKKAKDIAELIGTYKNIFICELPLSEGIDKIDVNDFYNQDRDSFKKSINNIMSNSIEYKHKNRPFPYLTDKGKPKKLWENLDFLLWLNDITVKYNKVSNKIEIDGMDRTIGYDGMATDVESLCVDKDFTINKMQLTDYLHRIAMKNQYSPIQDYLLDVRDQYKDNKELQETDFIKELYETLKVVDDSDFKYNLFKKWLIKTVALAFNDDGEISSDGVLVFQGEQGIGKSRWITSISPRKEWVGDGLSLDTSDKDSVITATGFWICELAELENVTTKKEQGSLKAFLTSTVDRYRVPYGRNSEEFPRMTSFYGSVNQAEFLKDDTGNRRYWVLEIEDDINYEHDVNLNGLWGQLTYMYLDQESKHWLEKEDITEVNRLNDKHRILSPVEQKLMDSYDWTEIADDSGDWDLKTSTEIANAINIRMNYGTARDISTAWTNILKESGYNKQQIDSFKKRSNQGMIYRVPRRNLTDYDLPYDRREQYDQDQVKKEFKNK